MSDPTNPGDRAILLRYHEIALKGENRGWFEERLAINARKLVQRALGKEGPRVEVSRLHGRILIQTEWNDRVREALDRVFGISSYSPMRSVETEIGAIARASIEEFERRVQDGWRPRSFRVLTRRSDKALGGSSMEIDRAVGAAIHGAYPDIAVDLENPELTLGIEVRFERSHIWTEKLQGRGGLPVGTNGKLLALLSGGLDSPVAALKALRRGSPVAFLHFYGAPFVGEEALTKVEDLARLVNRYQPDAQPLHIVRFGKIQEKVALATQPKLRTVLYRRLMVRIACRLAQRLEAEALVTGESLGQVASQTVENLATIDRVATLPILRPLIAFDKDEIIREAQLWGTYETSIRPAADCCTLFADRHPSIRTSLETAEREEAKFPLEELVSEALDSVETRRVF